VRRTLEHGMRGFWTWTDILKQIASALPLREMAINVQHVVFPKRRPQFQPKGALLLVFGVLRIFFIEEFGLQLKLIETDVYPEKEYSPVIGPPYGRNRVWEKRDRVEETRNAFLNT